MDPIKKQQENYQIKGGNEMLYGVLSWVQHHPRLVLGGLLGFILGLLIKWLGFWYTLLLIVFVVIGAVIGKYLDERRGVGQVLDRLFTSEQ